VPAPCLAARGLADDWRILNLDNEVPKAPAEGTNRASPTARERAEHAVAPGQTEIV
jgi:hypothetical protein